MDLHVSIQGDSLDVSQKKKVMLRALEPGIFIQTDKAVYKPGQQGEGRDGVCLDEGPGDSRFSLAPTQCELMEMGGSPQGALGPPALAQSNARTCWLHWLGTVPRCRAQGGLLSTFPMQMCPPLTPVSPFALSSEVSNCLFG